MFDCEALYGLVCAFCIQDSEEKQSREGMTCSIGSGRYEEYCLHVEHTSVSNCQDALFVISLRSKIKTAIG